MPKINNVLPIIHRPCHHPAVTGAGNFPNSFRSVITIIKATAKFLWNDIIISSDKYRHRPVILAQIIFRWKPVHQHQTHRQERHVLLRDVSQPVVRRQQNHPRHLVGISSGQITRHPRAQRFTRHVQRPVRAEQSHSLVRCAKEIVLTRLSLAIPVPRIFQNENIQGRGLLDHIGVVRATYRAAAIAIDYQHPAFRRLPRRHSFHSHRLPCGIFPAFEPRGPGENIGLPRRVHRRKVNETPLQESATQTDHQVECRKNQQPRTKSPSQDRYQAFGGLVHKRNRNINWLPRTIGKRVGCFGGLAR